MEVISDEHGVYSARAWLKIGSMMDADRLRDLFAWVRSKPPTKILRLCSAWLSDEDVLALLDATADAGNIPG